MEWLPLIAFIYTVLKDLLGWWHKRREKQKRRPRQGKRRK
ncbi:hypothetical protein DNHGIG_25730 [Collibacillus ludicampi]|uniref:Uncharacterized protein n=1 Tax=Collibacillus ludicampi TaxID=2771369 RepID=A0AAV4LGU1_9BACL|nr:hypothetical protein DNHGIG_25730 [Collibacillus ludicampi]